MQRAEPYPQRIGAGLENEVIDGDFGVDQLGLVDSLLEGKEAVDGHGGAGIGVRNGGL